MYKTIKQKFTKSRKHVKYYTYGHYIIAYKHRNTLWYFDPQNRKHTRFMDKIVKGQIVDVGGFDVRLDSPTPLKSTTCPLNLYG